MILKMFVYSAISIVLLVGCSSPIATPTPPPFAPTFANIPTDIPEPTMTQEVVPLPFSELGPYYSGTRGYEFQDANRNGRRVILTIYYPAKKPEGATGNGPTRKAVADATGAPYPVILESAKVADIFGPHLASYGFIVVGINGQDSKDHWGQWLTDYPLDIVFALNQIAANPLEELVDMIDAEYAGAMGYSFDGYTSLALSGARVDPEFYLTQCSNATAMNPAPPAWWIDYICNPTGGWDELVGNAGLAITTSNDGLWKALTDDRIRAVMPMAPEGAWLFGERGLAAVDRPTLIIGATADGINIYDLEAAYIFEHLGTPNRTMISFVDQGHMMIYDPDQVARMKHFAVAFFGFHLQGHDDYSKYFSEDFVGQYDDLVWGVYNK